MTRNENSFKNKNCVVQMNETDPKPTQHNETIQRKFMYNSASLSGMDRNGYIEWISFLSQFFFSLLVECGRF